MKLLFILIGLTALVPGFAQINNVHPKKQTTTPAAKTTLKPSTFKKSYNYDSTLYYMSDVVMVDNGKDEKVPVTFSCSVSVKEWDEKVKNIGSDQIYFALVSSLLTVKAQYSLKNPLSFQPFDKQFFMLNEGSFVSNYKMMGRNGYGNMIETEALVTYNPSTE